jgi:D-alanine-D-alanine ligase
MLRIGITIDLKTDYKDSCLSPEDTAEFDSEETLSGLEAAIRSCGPETRRIGNIKSLAASLTQGEKWDFVFNLAEGLSGLGRESAVPCLLEAWNIPYSFSDPLTLALCLHKGRAKSIVRDAGLETPDFAVLEKPQDAARLTLPYPLFVKPVAEGTGKGITAASKITSPEELEHEASHLLAKYSQPVLVETYLPGREFTVGLLGTGEEARIAGCMEVLYTASSGAEIYSYINKAEYEKRVTYVPGRDETAQAASNLALAAYKVLGCRDGGRLDIRCDSQGKPSFIEANPLAGLNPIHSDLPILARFSGISYEELIRQILESGLKRAGLL